VEDGLKSEGNEESFSLNHVSFRRYYPVQVLRV